jgi:hypothetical protein
VEFLLLEFDDQKRNLTNSFRKKIADVLFFASDLFSTLREQREVIIFLIDETRSSRMAGNHPQVPMHPRAGPTDSEMPPYPNSQVVGCDMCDIMVPMHTFRDDQHLVNDRIVKAIQPRVPLFKLEPSESETPAHIQGLVQTLRIVKSPASAEEHRELCSADLFDAVLSSGGALTGGDLSQG